LAVKLRKPHRLGVVLLGTLFVGVASAVAYRLYDLQHVRHESYATRADRQHYRRVVLQPERGDILDRTGRPLAQSTGRLTIYVRPSLLRVEVLDLGHQGRSRGRETSVAVERPTTVDKDELAVAIARHTGDPVSVIRQRLDAPRTVPLARRIRPELADRILSEFSARSIDGRGFWLERESVRLYPTGIASPVIGFCGRGPEGDTDGIAGLELFYNDKLVGRTVETRASHSGLARTHVLEPWSPDDLLAARGNTLVLTLDTRIQQTMEEVLAETVEKFNADAAGAVIMDVRNGAIIGMASFPTFDNNQFTTAPPASMRNRILTDPLETGSVAKLFTAAKLIERGYLSPDTLVDCEGGFAVVEGRRLRDAPGHAPLRVVTFRESLRWSSNVGIVKVAQALNNRDWYNDLRLYGFGARTGIDLPGEGSGIMHPLQRWTRLSRTSLPMGYEIALTPIQIVAAISALANGGEYHIPHVVKEIRDPRGNVVWQHSAEPDRRIVRPTTSAIMRELMQDIVDNGTGRRAQIPGYSVGGKTGTTRKSDVRTRREYIASFAGVIPADEPRLAIYIYVDGPRTAFYASQVAAPAFQQIATAAALHLGLPPNREVPLPPAVTVASSRQRIQQPIDESPTGPLDTAASTHMPDFRGLTMNAARLSIPAKVGNVRLLGSGVVSDQFPPPGEPLSQGTEIVLHFSPRQNPSQGANR
jgi:cell division protein FtsI (penicillin-binding protein 3)